MRACQRATYSPDWGTKGIDIDDLWCSCSVLGNNAVVGPVMPVEPLGGVLVVVTCRHDAKVFNLTLIITLSCPHRSVKILYLPDRMHRGRGRARQGLAKRTPLRYNSLMMLQVPPKPDTSGLGSLLSTLQTPPPVVALDLPGK